MAEKGPGRGGSASPVSEAKKELRRRATVLRGVARARLGAGEAGHRLASRGLGFLHVAAGSVVSGFLSIGEEIDPVPLLERLHLDGHRLCLPVMVGKGLPLIFRAWVPGDPLAERMWRIREPRTDKPQVEPDIVLVPLLAVDAEGWRLGYGGGYYDRTLRDLRGRKSITAVGLAYDEQVVDAVPHLDYDEPLDWVLTPSGPLRCRKEQNE